MAQGGVPCYFKMSFLHDKKYSSSIAVQVLTLVRMEVATYSTATNSNVKRKLSPSPITETNQAEAKNSLVFLIQLKLLPVLLAVDLWQMSMLLLTYILYEDTQPVIRAIGVSHTACKDEFRQNIRSHS